MFPWVTGFQWTTGNVIFLGLFFSVILLVLGTLARAVLSSRRALAAGGVNALRWDMDFEELPPAARVCRHELSGDVPHRTCHNGFDCRHCALHPKLEAASARRGAGRPGGRVITGFDMPPDRLYHRGHTWARPETDGTMTVGLDDLGRRLLGRIDNLELPALGSRLAVSGPAWSVRRNGWSARLLSPLDGEVIELGGPDDAWVVKLRPIGDRFETTHLLRGREVGPWMMREMERLQLALATGPADRTLADGGLPVDDMPAGQPAADWDGVWGEMFLMS